MISRPVTRFAAAAIVAFALLAASIPAAAQPFPRLGLYGSVTGSGAPFVKLDGTLDPVALDQVARYHEVILDVNPLTPYRPDVIAALRQRHPGIHILAYVLGHDIWNAADADSLNHYPTRYRRLVRDAGGFLYNKVGGQLYPGADVNLAKRDASGRYTVAEGLAALLDTVVVQSGQWDGIFFDVYCQSLLWTQDASRQIDYSAAGYPSLAAFDAGWAAGADTLANRIRRLAGGNAILVGNCAGSAHEVSFNGWMRENFPLQNGGTWYSNVTDEPHGYFANDANFQQPAHDYIFSALQGSNGNQYSSENARRVRIGLATAALGEGYGVFGPSNRDVNTAPYHQWWYDEYGVDLTTGHAASDLAHTGWLGQPVSARYQQIWAGTNQDAVSNPGFESNVTSGWTFGTFAPAMATISRDATTAAVGSSSCHIQITTASTVDWHVNLTSTATIPVFVGYSYSVTFWAKASAPRTIPLTATLPGGGAAATSNVTIGTTWKQYQVILLPTANASSSLEFFLGTQAGDVWFDDVHFQQGATNVYRRDFQNGSVVVNPSDQVLQVPVGAGFKRILGTVDPLTNDGAVVTTVTVPPSDAIFLIATAGDHIPPAAIQDVIIKP